MADRYWVGGTASWDATAGAKWATTSGGAGGAAVPTASDDVYFDAASGAVTVTLATSVACRSLDFLGFTGTFTHGSNLAITIGTTTARADHVALRLATGMTYTLGSVSSSRIAFTGSGDGTPLSINYAGKNCGQITIGSGAAGTWVLASNVVTSVQADFIHTRGTFDTGGFNLTTGTYQKNNSNTCRLIMNGSTWTLGSTVSNTFQMVTTGMTMDANTATFTFTGASGTNTPLNPGGLNFNGSTINLNGSGNKRIGPFTAKRLTRTGTAVTTDGIVLTGDVTVDTLSLVGNSPTNSLTITGETSLRTIHVLVGPATVTNATISTLAALDQHVALTDTLGMVDAATKARTVPVTDAFGMTDGAVQTDAVTRPLVDTLGMVDSVALAPTRALVDTLGLTDAVAERRRLTIVDAFDVTDTTAQARRRAIVDQLGFADTPTRSTILTRAIVNLLGLHDVASRTAVTHLAVVDHLGVADAVVPSLRRVHAIVDAFALADGPAVALRRVHNLIDALGLSDELSITQIVVPELGARIDIASGYPTVAIDLPLAQVTFVAVPTATVTIDAHPGATA